MKQFDVVIVEIATGKIASVIGRVMNEKEAERRLETGLSRINENFFVDIVPANQYKVGDIKKGVAE
jgi:hypothetical protein